MARSAKITTRKNFSWLYDLLMVVVLVVAAYFRLTGSDWGQLNIQHPDENFMTSVTLSIRPVHTLAEYFNTSQSSLNPAVVGYPAYVYGTLPLIIVRYLADFFGRLNQVTLFGRQLSAVADLGTITLLYLIIKRLYKAKAALLGALFSSLAVMQIQQSHFYTTDNFTTFFMFLAMYFAAIIATGNWFGTNGEEKINSSSGAGRTLLGWMKNPLTYWSILFGTALGMAAASKLNAAALAIVLPIALFSCYHQAGKDQSIINNGGNNRPVKRSFEDFLGKAFIFLVIGAIATIISFRIFQPYAFSGPGFLGVKLNPAWVEKIHEQRLQATPNTDLPWALQWARRTHLFSFKNLTVWGLGLPLGILAWAGCLWMGWRMLKGEWRQHLLLWSWTVLYFGWQSLQFNPTMRYQLPIYPLLAAMAAWLLIWLWENARDTGLSRALKIVFQASSLIFGILVLVLTGAYAYAFSRIYVREETRMAASEWIYDQVPGPINIHVQDPEGKVLQQPLPFSYGGAILAGLPFQTSFIAHERGELRSIILPHVLDSSMSGTQALNIILSTSPNPLPQEVLVNTSLARDFSVGSDPRGEPVEVFISESITLEKGMTYYLQITTTGGTIALKGASVANETDYDYPLPFRTAEYDAFGGIYPGDLNLQVYWDDNAEKIRRFQDILEQTDYIFIPTNHQYGQITRLPERYPLTTEYYRQLLGCPEGKDLIWCYYVAEPGMFKGNLGFELAATFESYPSLGPLVINDSWAEEAFTFYDHPKVLIFRKQQDYSPQAVQAILGKVDLTKAVHLTPGEANHYKSLMLSDQALVSQQGGGTWAEIFDRLAVINSHPAVGLITWYLAIFLLGLITYPIVRAAFPGLADHGYPLSRVVGLLLWAWLAWLGGSLGLTYSKTTIGIALLAIVIISAWLAWRQRKALVKEFQQRWRYFLVMEIIFLAFFLIDLIIRIGNPDLWHAAKGGERPMDFAYFNAILKSSSFPPYDPWFAGGYINYYYLGYVIVGTPVIFLGIVPSIAFNFILPTLFACLAVSAFSLGWNLLNSFHQGKSELGGKLLDLRMSAGLSAASAMVLVGNLGIVRLLGRGFQQIAAPGGYTEGAGILQRAWWFLKGFFRVLGGASLPYGRGDWYWFTSRIFPPSYNEFYEFPVFTFIYSDLHAHGIALMLTVLAISWALSVLLSKGKWESRTDAVLGFLAGGLIIGSLKPTNTWDYYTYLVLAAAVLAYTTWVNAESLRLRLPVLGWLKKAVLALGAVIALYLLSSIFFQPFSQWFSQAYASAQLWKGARTPLSTYLTQWGVFLFFIVSWLAWETRQWLASTPLSAARKLRPYRSLIITSAVIFILLLVFQQVWIWNNSQGWKGISILWLVLPLTAWTGILFFRSGIPLEKRLVLFMIGTGLLLTMLVEIVVISGDIGRFNTVFKFGLQSWILLGLSAAACFTWLLMDLGKWLPGWRIPWQVAAVALAAGASLVLIIGGADKIRDRMNILAPHTLDSMQFMDYATYADYGFDMDLSEDYRAILWLQDNVKGSPVIVEAAAAGVQYRWHSRFSIYTGLPDVVGWEWHQVQQRVHSASEVIARGKEVDDFYKTTDLEKAQKFLQKYRIRYIIVGQLERAKYAPGASGGSVDQDSPDGLLKFESYNGSLWKEVYREGQTVIYEVQ